MIKLLKSYQKSSFETKVFIWTAIIYGLTLVISTVYPYARLDFVRSYKTHSEVKGK